MWYDKYPGTPPRGSPLETLFVLVGLQRREADLLATKAQVLAALADSNEEAQAAIKNFKSYCDSMFPFLKDAENSDVNEMRRRLEEHVKHPLMIDTKMLRKEKSQQVKAKSINKFKVLRTTRAEIPGIGKV